MNWIVLSLLMLVASNIYYLILRVSQKRGIHAKYSMAANFSIPPILYFILGRSQSLDFRIPIELILLMIIIAFFLNYIGSYTAYVAMQKAPNGGYSVIIQKSYGVYTSVAAIYLFGSTLSPWKFIDILFIVACSAVVMGVLDKKSETKTNYQWVWLSILAFFCFGTFRLTGKWIIGNFHVHQLVYQTWLLSIVAMIAWIDLFIHKKI